MAIDGNTNLKGPINNIIVNGDVKFLRGEINYIGIYFKINEGEFSLVNNEPFVALKGETEIERYDDTFNRNVEDTIKLTIEKSPLQDIKFKFESQNYPSTSPKEAMNLAISGGSMEGQSGAEKEQYMKREFYKLIDNTLTTPIVKMLLQSTGVVDFVKVNTNIAEKTLNSQPTNSLSYNTNKNTNFLAGSSFTVGKYLNPNLFVSYAMTLEENTKNSTLNTEKTELVLQHEIEAKLKLKQNLYLKGVMELDSEKSESRDRQVKLEYSFPFLSGKKNNTNKKNTSKEIA